MKLRKAQVRKLVNLSFPNYKGKKFNLEFRETYHLENYWSGGTKKTAVAINKDGQVSLPDNKTTNPFNKEAHSSFDIPVDICLIEHCRFCRKDLGLRFIFHPNTSLLPKLITEGKEGRVTCI